MTTETAPETTIELRCRCGKHLTLTGNDRGVMGISVGYFRAIHNGWRSCAVTETERDA